jgi:hypothetical protein
MAITYYTDKVQVSHSLSEKETEEINKYFGENSEKILRLYWFEENNDFSFLKNIKNVKKLEINYSKIDDFDFLGNIDTIEYLDINEIDGNQDITPIGELKSLKTLNLNLRKATKTNDLSCLNNLVNLEELDFQGKFKKKTLKLEFNNLKIFGPQLNVINIDEICQLKNLGTLKLINQKIDSLVGIEKIEQLKNLFISTIKIDNQNVLSPIFLIKTLENLSLSYIKAIEDFSFIQNKSQIKNLDIWTLNGLESLNGIENLVAIENYSQCGEHKNRNTIDFSKLLHLQTLKNVKVKVGIMSKEPENKLNLVLDKIKGNVNDCPNSNLKQT